MPPRAIDDPGLLSDRHRALPIQLGGSVGGGGVAERGAILVVDDEPTIREVVGRFLAREGFWVTEAATGEEALLRAAEAWPRLVVLDLVLPGLGGHEVCRRLRAIAPTPIIMLTAKGEEQDRIQGFALGADDYVVKPFSPGELVARVRAVLRRAGPSGGDAPFEVGEFRFLPAERIVELAGRPLSLTVREFDLLLFLARRPRQVQSRRSLLESVWGSASYIDGTTVTVHVRRLREKIEPDLRRPRYVQTVWGTGYKFVP